MARGESAKSENDGKSIKGEPDQRHYPADSQITMKQPELSEQQRPIVFSCTDEGQFLRSRVLHVRRNVPAILTQPPQRYGGTMPIPLAPERNHESQRQEELRQGAARQSKEFTTYRKYEVARFVNREIKAVEPAVLTGSPQNLPTVDSQQKCEDNPPATL